MRVRPRTRWFPLLPSLLLASAGTGHLAGQGPASQGAGYTAEQAERGRRIWLVAIDAATEAVRWR